MAIRDGRRWLDMRKRLYKRRHSIIQTRALLTSTEKFWLHETATCLPENAVWVDIGTRHGGSAEIVLAAHPTVQIWTVDPRNGRKSVRRKLNARFEPYGDRIHLVDAKSVEGPQGLGTVRRILDESGRKEFDGAFIDGDHGEQACMGDITTLLPHIRPGGILCGHDCYVNKADGFFMESRGVLEAVRKCFATRGWWRYERIWYVIV